ncbi:MAG: signal peptidase I [Arachnia sp.]
MRSALKFTGRTLAWIVILAAGAAVTVAVLIPRLGGAAPYTLISGSMAPQYPAGTLVVVRPVDPADISVGDVVTVQLDSGKEAVVTHRVVEIQHRADGELQFVTKGDANDIPDADVRMAVQIRGQLWYSVPYLGYVSTALSGQQRSWLVTALAAGLIGYAVWMFVGTWRERRKGGRPAPKGNRGVDEKDLAAKPQR